MKKSLYRTLMSRIFGRRRQGLKKDARRMVMESLEQRLPFAISTSFLGGVLTFTGDGANDRVVLESTATAGTVKYDDGVSLSVQTQAGVQSIVFDGLGGDDQLILSFSGGQNFLANSGSTMSISFNGGSHGANGDTVVTGGGSGSFTGSYAPSGASSGTLNYVNAGTTTAVGFTGVERIDESVQMGSYTATTSSSANTINVVDGPLLSPVSGFIQGPVVVDGGDRDDHGSFLSGNQAGWLYIEQLVDFIYDARLNYSTPFPNRANDILAIGVDPSTTAASAINSAAGALGLNVTLVNGASISSVNFNDYDMLYVPSNNANVSGGISGSELDLLEARKTDIQAYIRAGGGLLALTDSDADLASPSNPAREPFAWLEIPDPFTIVDFTSGGITRPLRKTQAAIDAGLTIDNLALSNGTPYHNSFTGPVGFNGLLPFVLDTGTVNNGEGPCTDTLAYPCGNDNVITLGQGVLNTQVGGGQALQINDGGTNDFTTINVTRKTTLNVNGANGGDTLTVNLTAALNPVGLSTLNVNGQDGSDTLSVVRTSSSATSNIVGGADDDRFTIDPAGTVYGTVDGGAQGAGGDLLDYSAYSAVISVNLATGVSPGITGGIVAGSGGDVGSSIENIWGGSNADQLLGDADQNTIVGNGGSDTINAQAGADNVNGSAGSDLIRVTGTEAEFDVIQGGTGAVEDVLDYDIVRNIGAGPVTLNGFNSLFDDFANSVDEYDGAGYSILGNGNGNELHFGFTIMTNVPGLNSGTNNDDVTTSRANTSEVAYDGDAGTDHVTLVLTPDHFGALTTADILIVQDYVSNPTGKTLTLTAEDTKGNFTATNFEAANIAVYDDDVIIDVTTCFLAIVSEDQIIEGTMGNDTLTGTNLTDLIFGEDGNDVITGGNAIDCIFGGAHNDTISGENLNDILVGGSGDDTIYGGDDEDSIFGGSGNDVLFGEFGHDTINGGSGNDQLDGGAEHDTLNGGPGVDTVLGGSSPDRILIRGAEAVTDVIDGGSEYDTLEIIAGTGTATLQGFSLANTGVETVSNIEQIVGNNQTLQGTAAANLFDLTGIVGPTGLASIDGLGGIDTITGTATDDVINGGDGDDILTGGDGYDTINGGNDNDTIDGGLHNDTINGGAGTDTITAGAGYDIVQVSSNEAENDSMNGGADTDTIVALGASAITLNSFNSLTNGFEGWVGNGLSIQGNGNANTLNFQMIGTMTGVPFIDGGSNNDTITGTNGVDELRGSDGDDILLGLGGTDTLRGGNDNDSLNGGDGIDQLYGDAGVDTITTGAGRDVVRFANDDLSTDTITDFALYSDYINLSAYGLGWTYGSLSFFTGVGFREVILPNGKRIRLNGWNRNPGSSQFQF